MQRRHVIGHARITRYEMQLRDRNIKLVAVRVFDAEEFTAVAYVEFHQTLVATDAVIDVHDRRTDGEFGKVAQDRVRIARRQSTTARLLRAVAIKLAFGEDSNRWLRECKSRIELRDGDENVCILLLVIPAFAGMTSYGRRIEKLLPRCHDVRIYSGRI